MTADLSLSTSVSHSSTLSSTAVISETTTQSQELSATVSEPPSHTPSDDLSLSRTITEELSGTTSLSRTTTQTSELSRTRSGTDELTLSTSDSVTLSGSAELSLSRSESEELTLSTSLSLSLTKSLTLFVSLTRSDTPALTQSTTMTLSSTQVNTGTYTFSPSDELSLSESPPITRTRVYGTRSASPTPYNTETDSRIITFTLEPTATAPTYSTTLTKLLSATFTKSRTASIVRSSSPSAPKSRTRVPTTTPTTSQDPSATAPTKSGTVDDPLAEGIYSVSRSHPGTRTATISLRVWCSAVIITEGGTDALGDKRSDRVLIELTLHNDVWDHPENIEQTVRVRYDTGSSAGAQIDIAKSTTARIKDSGQQVLLVTIGYSEGFVPDDDVFVSLEGLGVLTRSETHPVFAMGQYDPNAQPSVRVRKEGQAASPAAKQEKQALEAMTTTAAVGGAAMMNAAAISNMQTMAVVGSLSCLPSRVRKQSEGVSWVISPLYYVVGEFPHATSTEDNVVVWNLIFICGIMFAHSMIVLVFRTGYSTFHGEVTWQRAMRKARYPNISLAIWYALMQGTLVNALKGTYMTESDGFRAFHCFAVVFFVI
eukprot:PhM_4_TR16792/c2_g1_i1/m.50529